MRLVAATAILSITVCACGGLKPSHQAEVGGCWYPPPDQRPSSSVTRLASHPAPDLPEQRGALVVLVRWSSDSIAATRAPEGPLGISRHDSVLSSSELQSYESGLIRWSRAVVVLPADSIRLAPRPLASHRYVSEQLVRAGYRDTVMIQLEHETICF